METARAKVAEEAQAKINTAEDAARAKVEEGAKTRADALKEEARVVAAQETEMDKTVK